MTNKQFTAFTRQLRRKQDELILNKGYDYTQGNPDRFYNFKFVARHLGLSPMQVWGVYWLKHVLAILTFIKTGRVKSERIEERFHDEATYNLLGEALLQEQKKVGRYAKTRRKNKKKLRQSR